HGDSGAAFDIALDLLDSVMRRASWAKTKARRREPGLKDRPQHLRDRLLKYPIHDGCHGQGQLHSSSTSFRTSLKSSIPFIPFEGIAIQSSNPRSGSTAIC